MIKHYIKTSRPITWIIHINMVIIGAIVAGNWDISKLGYLIPMLLMFSLPYSAVIFAVNDYYDFESDNANIRKGGLFGQQHNKQLKNSLLKYTWGSIFISALLLIPYQSLDLYVVFLLMTVNFYYYSSPPFRFKSLPIIDFVSGGLFYAVPIVAMGYLAAGGDLSEIVFDVNTGIGAVLVVTTVSHIMAAILDMKADSIQGLKSTPLFVGRDAALVLSLAITAIGGYLLRNSVFLMLYMLLLFAIVSSFLLTHKKNTLKFQINLAKYFTLFSSTLGLIIALTMPELFLG